MCADRSLHTRKTQTRLATTPNQIFVYNREVRIFIACIFAKAKKAHALRVNKKRIFNLMWYFQFITFYKINQSFIEYYTIINGRFVAVDAHGDGMRSPFNCILSGGRPQVAPTVCFVGNKIVGRRGRRPLHKNLPKNFSKNFKKTIDILFFIGYTVVKLMIMIIITDK